MNKTSKIPVNALSYLSQILGAEYTLLAANELITRLNQYQAYSSTLKQVTICFVLHDGTAVRTKLSKEKHYDQSLLEIMKKFREAGKLNGNPSVIFVCFEHEDTTHVCAYILSELTFHEMVEDMLNNSMRNLRDNKGKKSFFSSAGS